MTEYVVFTGRRHGKRNLMLDLAYKGHALGSVCGSCLLT